MTTVGTHLVAAFLAAPPTPPPGKGAEWGKAAPVGLLVIVLMGIALFLLVKSMSRHMRKVAGQSSFETQNTPDSADSPGTRVATGAGSVVTGTPDEPASRPDIRSDIDPTS